ncbi:MAG: 3-isopropylmalate dehydratase large subunit, partial [Clostridiales bacterium]|nr:3-isopropylmalate dehydratase large subunit [Clostridiales bacterium]
MAMTIAEKILASHSGASKVSAGEYVTAKIDQVCIKYSILDIPKQMEEAGILGGLTSVWDKEKVMVILDYWAPAVDRNVKVAQNHVDTRQLVKKLGLPHFYDVRSGICHQVMMNKGFVYPGALIVATDSHTPTYGSLNCAGTGIGEAEMAWVLTFGELWFRVPETVKVMVNGQLAPNVMGKDIFLHISGRYGMDFAQYKSIEWTGTAVDAMSLDSRTCIANQSVEIGAKFSLFEADQKVFDYLKKRTCHALLPVTPDPDAIYEKEIFVEGEKIVPMVAEPHSMGVTNPATYYNNIKINQANIGGCAAGRLEDIKIAAKILKGKKIHKEVRCILGAADWE